MTKKESKEKTHSEVPWLALEDGEFDSKTIKRINELMKSEDEEDKIKYFSLMISRGETENARLVSCKCGITYLVMPEEVNHDNNSKCNCGEIVEYGAV